MSQLVKTKRQANFKGFNRFGVFKGLVEQKNVEINTFLCKLDFFGTRDPLKRLLHSRFKMAHACQKRSNLHTNSSNKLLFKKKSLDRSILVYKNIYFNIKKNSKQSFVFE
jgi:hypothetical protein